MKTVTFGELKTRSRQRADMVNSQFISEAELETFVNESVTDLYDLLITSYDEDYFLKSEDITIVNGQEDYDLPADFYKMRGVDLVESEKNISTLKPFNFQERNRFKNALVFDYSFDSVSGSRYRIMGNRLRLTPVPDSNKTLRVWYNPVFTDMTDDADTFNGVNGYEELVIVLTAIKMLTKEESDTTQLERRYANLWKRVMDTAPNRDAGMPESVQDVRRYYDHTGDGTSYGL